MFSALGGSEGLSESDSNREQHTPPFPAPMSSRFSTPSHSSGYPSCGCIKQGILGQDNYIFTLLGHPSAAPLLMAAASSTELNQKIIISGTAHPEQRSRGVWMFGLPHLHIRLQGALRKLYGPHQAVVHFQVYSHFHPGPQLVFPIEFQKSMWGTRQITIKTGNLSWRDLNQSTLGSAPYQKSINNTEETERSDVHRTTTTCRVHAFIT